MMQRFFSCHLQQYYKPIVYGGSIHTSHQFRSWWSHIYSKPHFPRVFSARCYCSGMSLRKRSISSARFPYKQSSISSSSSSGGGPGSKSGSSIEFKLLSMSFSSSCTMQSVVRGWRSLFCVCKRIELKSRNYAHSSFCTVLYQPNHLYK